MSSRQVPPPEDPCELSRSGGYRRRRLRRRDSRRWREHRSRCWCLRLRERRLKEPCELADSSLRRWCRRCRRRSGLAHGPGWRRLEHSRKLTGRGLRRWRRRSLTRCRRGRSALTDGLRWRGRLEHSCELAGPSRRRTHAGGRWRCRQASSRIGYGWGRYVPYAYPGKRVRQPSRTGRSRRRWRSSGFPFQVRQPVQRLSGHERSPLVISDFEQIGPVRPLRRTELLQKVRMQPRLLAHKQEHGDLPPRGDLAGVEHLDALILQQIQ